MKKSLLITLFLVLFLIPGFSMAAGLVPCGNPGENACGIGDFFIMLDNIYNFLVKAIATPLAALTIIVGAVFILISAGNPNLQGTGKKIIYASIIGLVLVWGSWLIINTILCTGLGYCTWSTL